METFLFLPQENEQRRIQEEKMERRRKEQAEREKKRSGKMCFMIYMTVLDHLMSVAVTACGINLCSDISV